MQFPKDIDKLNKPVDKTNGTSPQTVNALYTFLIEIVFPSYFTSLYIIIKQMKRANYMDSQGYIAMKFLMVLMTQEPL
jgi:predicted metalloendopeptidase